MATTLETKALTVIVKRRTWRTQAFSDIGTNFRIEFFRETVYIDAATGEIIKQVPDAIPIVRYYSDFPAGDPALAIAQSLADLADQLDQEASEVQSSVPEAPGGSEPPEEVPGA